MLAATSDEILPAPYSPYNRDLDKFKFLVDRMGIKPTTSTLQVSIALLVHAGPFKCVIHVFIITNAEKFVNFGEKYNLS